MIRDNAMHCEAKKHAFRQTQDGVVVSFVLHPQDVPPSLALASLGTRYMLALVEIGDDEQPVAGSPVSNAASSDEPAPGKPHASWHKPSPAQQAGILCNDPAFTKFLLERYPDTIRNSNASQTVRTLCGVTSRSEIQRGTKAALLWADIVADYRAWMREPEIVG